MKAQPLRFCPEDRSYAICDPKDADHVGLHMEGPMPRHLLPVILSGSRDNHSRQPVWTWNGDVDKPTLKPSVLSRGGLDGATVNHVWINDGQVIYLDDCSHDLKGQTRPLLDWNPSLLNWNPLQ